MFLERRLSLLDSSRPRLQAAIVVTQPLILLLSLEGLLAQPTVQLLLVNCLLRPLRVLGRCPRFTLRIGRRILDLLHKPPNAVLDLAHALLPSLFISPPLPLQCLAPRPHTKTLLE